MSHRETLAAGPSQKAGLRSKSKIARPRPGSYEPVIIFTAAFLLHPVDFLVESPGMAQSKKAA